MRTRMLAAVYAVLAACAGSEPQPTLTITPSGNQTASGPVTITAGPVELANEVTWSTTVPGTISGDKGPSVVYHPPPSTQPVTVTAAARGQTKTVTFTTQGTALPGHTVTGLTGNVDVTYDQYDIPHIFCANQNDCYAVQGYIQAQDRLFQMDLFRRIARGKLAELVGSVQLGQDKQILTLFVTRDANRIENNLVAALDASTRAKLDAFASGVNAYIAFLKQNVALMPRSRRPSRPTTSSIGCPRTRSPLAGCSSSSSRKRSRRKLRMASLARRFRSSIPNKGGSTRTSARCSRSRASRSRRMTPRYRTFPLGQRRE